MQGFRSLPAVDRLAGELDGPHALAVAAARATIEERRRELAERRPGRARPGRPRPGAARAHTAAVAPTGHQRHRRDRAHEPRPRAAGTGGARSRRPRRGGLLQPRVGRRDRRARLAPRSRRGAADRAHRRRGGARRQQQRRRGPPGGRRARRSGQGDRRLARPARGDRRRLPDPGRRRPGRRPLNEVGTTNRTRRADYERAINADTGAILRAHPSNFRQLGFVQEVEIEELCELGVPVIDDVGSGNLAEDLELLADEPPVRRSVRAGAALVCFSGDKLLGGPQAGVMVGTRGGGRRRQAPPARARRPARQALARRARGDAAPLPRPAAPARIPVLEMLTADDATAARPRRAARRRHRRGRGVDREGRRRRAAAARAARPGRRASTARPTSSPPASAQPIRRVVGRIQDGRLLLDPRTLAEEEIDLVRAALA